jgi:hypothetical protein
MTAIIALTNREMEAVLDGRLDELEALGAELREQRKLKEDLLYAYRSHVQSHGC